MKAPWSLHLKWVVGAVFPVLWRMLKNLLILAAIILVGWGALWALQNMSLSTVFICILLCICIWPLILMVDAYFKQREEWVQAQLMKELYDDMGTIREEMNTRMHPDADRSVRPLHAVMVPNPNHKRDVDAH